MISDKITSKAKTQEHTHGGNKKKEHDARLNKC